MRILAIRTTIVTLALGCAYPFFFAQQKSAMPSQPMSFTREQIFQALMFRSGDAIRIFPHLASTVQFPKSNQAASRSLQKAQKSLEKEGLISSTDGQKLNAIASEIAAGKGRSGAATSKPYLAQFVTLEIQRKDPSFFGRFQTEISSGDQRRVQKVMDEASKLSSQVLYGQLQHAAMGDSISSALRASGTFFNKETFINMDAAINVNVAYNVDQVKYLTHYWSQAPELAAADRLRNDVLVDQITQAAHKVQYR